MQNKLWDILSNFCGGKAWWIRPLRYLLLILLLPMASGPIVGQEEGVTPGANVLTRGPVHEAFAGLVTFNPLPGLVVFKAPPERVEEMPPEQRPQGENVAWIAGYWGWDEERVDFVWISGMWRAVPPGRSWIVGYWTQTSGGYQWTSGYWVEANVREVTYLPTPPWTLENGPNVNAPTVDSAWTPGCWVWQRGRFAWSPGFWIEGRADWNWTPAHYVWTPRGYLFVTGFWDYPVEMRGVLFAPVYFEPGWYGRGVRRYSPSVVIRPDVFSEHLFLSTRNSHYYFGDYYSTVYLQRGFVASFSFQLGRYGYDPIYAHQRWEHRRDRDWERHVRTTFEDRRDHEAERPASTWVAQKAREVRTPASRPKQEPLGDTFSAVSKRPGGALQFQAVAGDERRGLAQVGQVTQKSLDERRVIETRAPDRMVLRNGGRNEASKAPLPRSPIPSAQISTHGAQSPARPVPSSRPSGVNAPEFSPRKPGH